MKTQNVTETAVESSGMDNEDIAHLAGFFDAVGNITISVVKNSNYRINYTLRPMLRVLRPDENDPILGKLMAYCDEHGVKYTLSEQSHGGDREGASIQWSVKDPDSVERFLEPMMDYLVSSFFHADLMLTEVLPAIREGKHRNKQGFYELMAFTDELRSSTAQKSDIKYTQDYFENEWSITK